jgi:5-methyltetrahydropteroyltriglutamate--homocysteine methyltransferase
MTMVSIRFPVDVMEDLKRVAPLRGFSGYQPLVHVYVGQGLQMDLERLENDLMAAEEYLHAVAEAMHTEYQAIVDAGFIVQVDDPFLTDVYSYASLSAAERRKTAEMYVEALNHGLRGVPSEKVRFHTCYGINEGPRVHDAPLKDIVDVMLKVHAGAYSFEAANARHEHEYHVWENVKLPDGKVLIPGVVTHASNIVEHPELIAERITRYAKLVGRENVIAGTDCGFSSQATYNPEVHLTVVWAKFQAMAEGARLATAQLWQ